MAKIKESLIALMESLEDSALELPPLWEELQVLLSDWNEYEEELPF